MFFGPDITFPFLSWTPAQLSHLTATDFVALDGSHPDFSSTGGVIRFGYARSNSNISTDLAYSTHHGIDNWSVFIGDAEPPSATIAAYAGVQITGTIGATYRIQYTLDLANPSWTNLADIVLPASPYTYFDPLPISATPKRFYRVSVAP